MDYHCGIYQWVLSWWWIPREGSIASIYEHFILFLDFLTRSYIIIAILTYMHPHGQCSPQANFKKWQEGTVFGWSMWLHSPYNFPHLRKTCTDHAHSLCSKAFIHIHFCSQHTKCSNFAFVISKMSDHSHFLLTGHPFPSSKWSSFTVVDPLTPFWTVMGNYGGIFNPLDHKMCPIGGAFDFGY